LSGEELPIIKALKKAAKKFPVGPIGLEKGRDQKANAAVARIKT
jgi:hypothetical protein